MRTPLAVPSFPRKVKLIGEVRAVLGTHEGVLWSYTTTGLGAYGHPELCLMLSVRERLDDLHQVPTEPLSLLRDLSRRVVGGDRLSHGSAVVFDQRVLGFGGAIVVDAAQVTLPFWVVPSTRVVIYVSAEEAGACRDFGPTRVLIQRGAATGCIPPPAWADRSWSRPQPLPPSFLATTPRVTTPDMPTAHSEGQRVSLRLAGPLPGVADLPAGADFALPTALAHQAHGSIVWTGSRKLRDIPDGSRIGGAFVLFRVDDLAVERAAILEDGFQLTLSRASWLQVREALVHGRSLDLPALRIEVPELPVAQRLLELGLPEEEMARRIDVQELVPYVLGLEAMLLRHFGERPPGAAGFDVSLQVVVEEERTTLEVLAMRPQVPSARLEPVQALVEAHPRPALRGGGPVPFRLTIEVWGGYFGAAVALDRALSERRASAAAHRQARAREAGVRLRERRRLR